MKRNSRARRAEHLCARGPAAKRWARIQRIIDSLMCMAVIVGVLVLAYIVMLRVLDAPAQGEITPATMEIYPPRP